MSTLTVTRNGRPLKGRPLKALPRPAARSIVKQPGLKKPLGNRAGLAGRQPKTSRYSEWRRVLFLESFFLLFGLGLVGRLIYIEVLQRGKYQNMAEVQHHTTIPLEAQRGLIYDRHQSILALNEACISVGLDLRQVKDRRQTADQVARIIGEPAVKLYDRIRRGRNFVWLKRRIEAALAPKIEALKLPGIRIEKDGRRRYPHKEIAAHVLGYTDIDNRGISGIELACDSLLRGQNGHQVIQKDAIGNHLPDLAAPEAPAVNGQTLCLTLDYIIQTIATEELKSALALYGASTGIVIVTDPCSGEILAMVSEPSFDPNHPGEYSEATRRNRAVADLFEPGSTFKIVTFGAVLQDQVKRPEDIIFCENGAMRFAGETVTDHGESYGNLSVAEVLSKSSNIGTVKLAKLLGSDRLYRSARDFGFGAPLGLAISGEATGVVKHPAQWSGFTLAAMAMGYEVSVTAMQMAMAYGAIANGGLLLQPKFIAAMSDHDGNEIRFDEPAVLRRVMAPEVARTLSGLLENVVISGTGDLAALASVRVAGKTGTAHKALQNTRGYSPSDFIASFAGYFPADKPRYLVFIMLENPRAVHWGGKVAAPTFERIATRILDAQSPLPNGPNGDKGLLTALSGTPLAAQIRNSFTSNASETIMETQQIMLPDLTSRQRKVGEEILKSLRLEAVWDGRGDFIINQMPPPGSSVLPHTKVTLQLFEVERTDRPIRMPNVIGLSARQALQQLSLFGVEATVTGSGRVEQQYPPAGALISNGVRCELRCLRPVAETADVELQ